MIAAGWILTAVSLGVLAWVHAGFPLLLLLQSRLARRPVARAPNELGVSLIVPVRDGEDSLARKIEDCLAQDLAPERLELLIASDGSQDRTVEIARSFGERVSVLDLPRRGKAFALDDAAARASREILAFTDVNLLLAPDALRLLLENFSDREVGGACARQVVEAGAGADGAGRGEGWYWRFDQWLKRLESETGSVFASDGALHAIRRELHRPIGDPAQADDMALSMRVVTQGRRLVWDERAVARETRPARMRAGFARKARVAAHSLRAIAKLGPPAWAQGGWSLRLLSHKLLRHLVPVFLLGALAGAALLVAGGSPAGPALLGLQGACYGLALLGLAGRGRPWGRARLLSAPAFFLAAHAAGLAGLWMAVTGRTPSQWRPSAGGSDA